MSVADTEATLRGYIDALLHGGNFASFFGDDVVWTTMEGGEEMRGRQAVRDFIVALHTQLFNASPKVGRLAVADDAA
jgi:hypothetical protein